MIHQLFSFIDENCLVVEKIILKQITRWGWWWSITQAIPRYYWANLYHWVNLWSVIWYQKNAKKVEVKIQFPSLFIRQLLKSHIMSNSKKCIELKHYIYIYITRTSNMCIIKPDISNNKCTMKHLKTKGILYSRYAFFNKMIQISIWHICF